MIKHVVAVSISVTEKSMWLSDKISLFTDKTFMKFVLVGMVNVTVGATVMFVFYNVFHFSYWVSSASNYIVGSIVSYFLNRYFTFNYHGSSWKSIAKFIINIAVCIDDVDTIRLQYYCPGECIYDLWYVSVYSSKLFRPAILCL